MPGILKFTFSAVALMWNHTFGQARGNPMCTGPDLSVRRLTMQLLLGLLLDV